MNFTQTNQNEGDVNNSGFPSAKVNINRRVRVVLTPFGRTVYNQDWTDLNLEPPEANYDDSLETELWELMRIFGPVMRGGMHEMPFVKNEIEFV